MIVSPISGVLSPSILSFTLYRSREPFKDARVRTTVFACEFEISFTVPVSSYDPADISSGAAKGILMNAKRNAAMSTQRMRWRCLANTNMSAAAARPIAAKSAIRPAVFKPMDVIDLYAASPAMNPTAAENSGR